MVISHLLYVSSIYYDPWHPPHSIYVPDSIFPQFLCNPPRSTSRPSTLHTILHTFLHPTTVFFSLISSHTHNRFTALWILDRTTRVRWHQKKMLQCTIMHNAKSHFCKVFLSNLNILFHFCNDHHNFIYLHITIYYL